MQGHTIRPATAADADALAEIHGDSVRTLGGAHYPSEVVAEWGAPRTGQRYRDAMARGGTFFLAIAPTGTAVSDQAASALGFSSYAVEGEMHRIAVYVRGAAARRGVGRALYEAGESVARANGARDISIEAALGAVPFWQALGFEVLGPVDHPLASGRLMRCIRMRKPLFDGSRTGADTLAAPR
jgi:ribosomal protein S18 acetylase RimI-like enzyme